MILAAGRGERLRPLTDTVPKPMLPLNGRPLLAYTVDWLRGHGVTELVINTHHCPEVIQAHFGDGRSFGVSIRYSHEPELRGTSGALTPWRSYFGGGAFVVMYGDNLTSCRLDRLLELHVARRAALTMAVHYREDVTRSGMAVVDDSTGRVTAFREKPAAGEAVSHWVSAGVLALEPRVFDYIPAAGASDFGRDVFPALLAAGEPVYAYRMTEPLRWADTPEDYARLQRLAAAGALL